MNTTPRERDPRFALQLPMRYRMHGEPSWHEGKMENISRSGLLFLGQDPIEPNALVEVSFVLPAIADETAAEVICSGRIARTIPPSGAANLSGFAAAISDYRFIRGLGAD